MVIVLRLDGGGDILELEDPSDLRRFHVRIEGDHGPGRIASAFASTGLGDFESAERAMVSVARVRALAESRVGAEWDGGFDAMLAYAAGKGWYDAATGRIQAHCEMTPSG
jgi:hypothetical protein